MGRHAKAKSHEHGNIDVLRLDELEAREVQAADESEQAEVAATAPFPLLGFLGLMPTSAKVAPVRRPRPWSSKGVKRFCVAAGARGA